MERDKDRGYDWLEFSFRPLKDGIHDSGYRFIKVVGVTMDEKRDGTVHKEELHQWADHLQLIGNTNIDVTRDGTIRIMSWGQQDGWITHDHGFFGSDAMFHAKDMGKAIQRLELEKRIIEDVYEDESM